jgi:hypothetical protein
MGDEKQKREIDVIRFLTWGKMNRMGTFLQSTQWERRFFDGKA